jgi:hypothetical protein
MECPTCHASYPDPPPDGVCCECGKEFRWSTMGSLSFTSYRIIDGKELPICPECLAKDAYPVAYVGRGGTIV